MFTLSLVFLACSHLHSLEIGKVRKFLEDLWDSNIRNLSSKKSYLLPHDLQFPACRKFHTRAILQVLRNFNNKIPSYHRNYVLFKIHPSKHTAFYDWTGHPDARQTLMQPRRPFQELLWQTTVDWHNINVNRHHRSPWNFYIAIQKHFTSWSLRQSCVAIQKLLIQPPH